ncbi:MaoC/PaaZ C-terminal domain-containing protein [Mycobacteroides abscessus]|uniref:MaoC/PaaZ C-terminal domain-containing protein n=1 Tax=Mycobacteroides abscessus TaxID=36809 RepID=UPI0013904345|nr:MaoC/PaaZ C-terminal domain-containing protein [Mycobacteroides abscessus]
MGEINEVHLKTVVNGGWCQARSFEVTQQQIAQYAVATNDPIASHRVGFVAPPVFAVVPSLATLFDLITEAVPDHLFRHTVHTRQQFEFYRQILPGMRLSTRGKVLSYCPAQRGTEVRIRLESHDEHGARVVDQVVTLHIRRFKAMRPVGDCLYDGLAAYGGQTLIQTVFADIDDDQPFRYAEASGDKTPIHLDISAARSAGLPDIILHGLCTLAFSTWAVLVTLADSHHHPFVKRLSAELVSPVHPGCQLATTVWRTGVVTDSPRFTFHSAVDGAQVLRGVADIGNALDLTCEKGAAAHAVDGY